MLEKNNPNNFIGQAQYNEIIDNQLWFPGYSIYRTAWCKKWISVKIFDPGFKGCFDVKLRYIEACYDWEIHHLAYAGYNVTPPNPPSFWQFEEAVRYFVAKKILGVKETTPSFWQLNKSPIFKQLFGSKRV